MNPFALTAALLCLAQAASADLRVTFDEGAPKDRFTFETSENCALTDAKIALDLTGSAGALIFDVTGSGAGVEVFQPFEIVAGRDALAALPEVKDGDTAIELDIRDMALSPVAFTIDVDDTMGAREITVTGSEILGAQVQLVSEAGTFTGAFDDKGIARIDLPSCG
jgi:hypothetical protein